jgi:predicted MPP superfamily phosphohydrolase
MLPVLIAVVIAAAVACVVYGIAIERRWFRLRRYDLAVLPPGPPSGDGTREGRPLTILHLSDLHFVRRDRKKARFLASLPEADVTVVTGDFLAEPEAVEATIEAVRSVKGRRASWFVLGSNDHYVPKPLNYLKYFVKRRKRRFAKRGRVEDLIAGLERDGWVDLTNVRELVEVDGVPIELLGLDDAHLRWQDLRVAPRRAPDRLGLAVMHSPDSAPESAALGYDLLVAGHTHGGQVRLPGLGALVTNSSMPPRLAAGLIRMGTAILHTSPGLGTSKYAPFRFACRPEATLLELRPRPRPRTA